MGPFDWQKLVLLLLVIAVAVAGSFWLWQSSQNTQIIYLPGHDLPAYHLIQEADLITDTLPVSDLSQDALTNKDELVNKYTLEAIGFEQIVTKSQVISSAPLDLVNDTTAVPIPSTAAMTFNGKISPGVVVTVWVIFSTDEPRANKAELLLQRALVLDVQEIEKNDDHPYITILAVPIDRQAEVLAATDSGSLTFTLVP